MLIEIGHRSALRATRWQMHEAAGCMYSRLQDDVPLVSNYPRARLPHLPRLHLISTFSAFLASTLTQILHEARPLSTEHVKDHVVYDFGLLLLNLRTPYSVMRETSYALPKVNSQSTVLLASQYLLVSFSCSYRHTSYALWTAMLFIVLLL